MRRYDMVTIGTASRDYMFADLAGEFLVPGTKTKPAQLSFPYGAKIDVNKTFFSFGGGGANVAVNAVLQGRRVAAIFAVGDDENGREIFNRLKDKGIDVRLAEMHENTHTAFAFILTAGKQREHVIFVHRGASHQLTCPPAVLRAIKTRWWYVGSLPGSGWKNILDGVFSQPGLVAWNPGTVQLAAGKKQLAPYLDKTHIVALNRQEAVGLVAGKNPSPAARKKYANTKTLLRAVFDLGPAIAVVTNGKNGTDVYNGEQFFHQPIIGGANVVDTTGVGDAHNGTFTLAFDHYQGDFANALLLAAYIGGAVSQVVGAELGFRRVLPS